MINNVKHAFHTGRRWLAYQWLNNFHARVVQIGITGSYGKTSTTYGLYRMLASSAPTLMTDLNLDTIYNVPITALKLRKQHKFIVFELGIDKPGEMDFHLEIVRPKIGIITGITPVHSDEEHLGSLDNIIREKRKLIRALPPDGVAILNYDDRNVREMAKFTQAKIIWYGLSSSSQYRAEDIHVSTQGIKFKAITPSVTFPVESPLLGRHNGANLMAAVAVGEQLGISKEKMQAVFASLEPLQGRLNIETGPKNIVLINDALRANPATTQAGLSFMDSIRNINGQKIAVLGEMGELGALAEEKHTEIGKYAANVDLSILLCVGNLTKYTAEAAISSGFPAEKVYAVPTVRAAANILQEKAQPGDLLYLKGSLLKHMERILLLLDDKEVGCQVVSCHFYHQCNVCPYLRTGFIETTLHE